MVQDQSSLDNGSFDRTALLLRMRIRVVSLLTFRATLGKLPGGYGTLERCIANAADTPFGGSRDPSPQNRLH